MANTSLTRTSGTSTNVDKCTFSAWVKRGTLGALSPMFSAGSSGQSQVVFTASDELAVYDGGTVILKTNRKFRDPNAWYHIVVTLDATQSGTDKAKLYVNGVQETSFATDGRSSFSSLAKANQSGEVQDIGSDGSGNFLGAMTHVHMTDNYAYQASTFGETDSTTNIWVPKTSPSVTYGTNGFFLKFENAGNLDLDSSPNNLTFATSGTLTQDTDSPTNNVCVMNGVGNRAYGFTFANANTSVTYSSGDWESIQGSIGASAGKWYYETKWNGSGAYMAGWTSSNFMDNSPVNYVGHTYAEPSYAIQASDGGIYYSTSSSHTQDSASWGDTFTSSDILGCAIDIDNGKIYWSKNGTWMNSGVPTSGSTGTGAFNIADTATNYFWQPVMSSYNGAQGMFNFGSGYFGTTQVSSANADANGHGAFEYAVPSGYYALNTKNLKEFG